MWEPHPKDLGLTLCQAQPKLMKRSTSTTLSHLRAFLKSSLMNSSPGAWRDQFKLGCCEHHKFSNCDDACLPDFILNPIGVWASSCLLDKCIESLMPVIREQHISLMLQTVI